MKHQNILFALLLILIFNSQQAKAQSAPGLHGQRLIIDGGISLMQNWTNLRYNELDQEREVISPLDGSFPLLFSLNYQIQGAYAISRLSMVGLNATFARMGYSNRIDQTVNANVHAWNFTFFYRRYLNRTGSIAPIGFYYQLGPSLMINTRFFKESINYYAVPETFGHESHPTLGLNLEFGRQTTLGKKLLFTYALQHTNTLSLNADPSFKFFGFILPESENIYAEVKDA